MAYTKPKTKTYRYPIQILRFEADSNPSKIDANVEFNRLQSSEIDNFANRRAAGETVMDSEIVDKVLAGVEVLGDDGKPVMVRDRAGLDELLEEDADLVTAIVNGWMESRTGGPRKNGKR